MRKSKLQNYPFNTTTTHSNKSHRETTMQINQTILLQLQLYRETTIFKKHQKNDKASLPVAVSSGRSSGSPLRCECSGWAAPVSAAPAQGQDRSITHHYTKDTLINIVSSLQTHSYINHSRTGQRSGFKRSLINSDRVYACGFSHAKRGLSVDIITANLTSFIRMGVST